MEEEFMSQECRQPLEAKNEKDMNSPLEPPEGTQPCQHLDFNSPRPAVDFRLSEL